MTVHKFPDRLDVLVRRAAALRNEMIERCQQEGGSEMLSIYLAMTVLDIGQLYDDPIAGLMEILDHLRAAFAPIPAVLLQTEQPLQLKIWTQYEQNYLSALEGFQAYFVTTKSK